MRPRSSTTSGPRSPSGRCRTTSRSSTRCPRRASASSTRKCCASATRAGRRGTPDATGRRAAGGRAPVPPDRRRDRAPSRGGPDRPRQQDTRAHRGAASGSATRHRLGPRPPLPGDHRGDRPRPGSLGAPGFRSRVVRPAACRDQPRRERPDVTGRREAACRGARRAVPAFLRRHRVFVVLLALGVLVATLVGYRSRKQQAAARLEDLHGRGLIAAMDRDNAKTNAESSQASLAAAEAQLAAARSQIETQRSQVALAQSNADGARAFLKIAQTNLDNTRILAPFSGYISARNLYPGASVNSQQAGTSTQAVGILVLQDIATVKVQLEVQERHITLVRLGSVARVLVDAYPDRAFEARATRLVHALDPRTRTLGVEMAIVNPDGLLKPGMYARVELVIAHHPGAILIHGEAVSNEGETPVVFVVKEGVVARRTIATGVGEGTLVEV